MLEALLLVVAALLIGYAKTAVGGLASISVAIFASVMPARESTAAILLLLITGVAAGFATMTANAAGPVTTLYLVAQGVEKLRFLGTSALLFFGVNLCKLPLSLGLGLFGPHTVRRTLLLAPFVLIGAWAGLRTVRRLSQARFDQAVLAASAVAAVALIVR